MNDLEGFVNKQEMGKSAEPAKNEPIDDLEKELDELNDMVLDNELGELEKDLSAQSEMRINQLLEEIDEIRNDEGPKSS